MSAPAPDPSAPAPLSVWLTGQLPSRIQRAGRYVPASHAHPGKMLPAIAAHAIATYTKPGELVLDPMCGIGTTLVEATHLGRDAVGVEYEPHWAQLARRNAQDARQQGATGTARVVRGDAGNLATLVPSDVRGRVALVLTSPPYGSSTHGHVNAQPGRGVDKTNDRYGHDRDNLAHRDLDQLLDAVTTIAIACAALMKPGAVLAMTARPYWSAGQLVDLPGRLTAVLVERTPLTLLDRNVALLAAVRDQRLVTRASFFQLDHVRKQRARGVPRHLIAHEDLLAFRLPPQAAGARGFAELRDAA